MLFSFTGERQSWHRISFWQLGFYSMELVQCWHRNYFIHRQTSFASDDEAPRRSRWDLLFQSIKYNPVCFYFDLICAERVQRELDEVVGQDRWPSVEDRQNLPYTDAVIHEIQRNMDLAPIALPHKMMCDTEYNGYVIPKVFYTLLPFHYTDIFTGYSFSCIATQNSRRLNWSFYFQIVM